MPSNGKVHFLAATAHSKRAAVDPAMSVASGRKVFTLRFEEGNVKEGIKRSETIGTYLTKELAVRNTTGAMSKKCSTGDPVDGDDGMKWDIVVRNTGPGTCPDEGFVFNFAIDRGPFSRIQIHAAELNKPFSEAATVAGIRSMDAIDEDANIFTDL